MSKSEVIDNFSITDDNKPNNDKPHYYGHRKRLRERFLTAGADALQDYELLEMLLFASNHRGDVKPLAKKLIAEFGSLRDVFYASDIELLAIDGVGESALSFIKLQLAIAQKILKQEATAGTVISSWQKLLDYCQLVMGSEKIEQFRIIFLDSRNQIIADEVQQTGTVNHTPIYPREVVKRALELHASSIILAHNHPSGDPSPSQADITMTNKIVETAKLLDIRIHDHLIIARDAHFSFRANGLM